MHLPPAMRRKGGFSQLLAVCLDVPDVQITTFDVASLAKNYGIPDCRAAGDAWINGGASLGLAVPSRVIVQELNVVLNPTHADMTKVVLVRQDEFQFDDRLGL